MSDAFADLFKQANGSLKTARADQSAPLNARASSHLGLNSRNPQSMFSAQPLLALGSYAASRGLLPSLNSAMNDLLLKSTQSASNLAHDPFAIFSASLSGQNTPKPAPEDDLLAFFLSESKTPGSKHSSAQPKPSQQASGDVDLLGEGFTDAFEPEVTTQQNSTRLDSSDLLQASRSATPEPPKRPARARSSEQQLQERRDSVLAELVSQGFSIEIANEAINRAGPDTNACIALIIRGIPDQAGSKDLQWQNLSNDMYKKASRFLDKSKKTLIKNIGTIHNQLNAREQSDMPAWIKNQQKHKERASERRPDGTSYEDYGTDEENFNAEEIQRAIRLQRQREQERQRERLQNLDRRSSSRQDSASPVSGRTPQSVPAPHRAKSNGGTPRELRSSVALHSAGVSSMPERRAPRQAPVTPGSSSRSSEAAERLQAVVQTPEPAPEPEVDLLGLSELTPSQKFKLQAAEETVYVSSRRRRQPTASAAPSPSKRIATNEPLNAFQQSDYDTARSTGSSAFSNGDYGTALEAYTKCMAALPGKHELRIVIAANLALTAIKIGDYKLAKESCNEGLTLLGTWTEHTDWRIAGKDAKYWCVRLTSRKAESLEMLESYPEALQCYMVLISELGVNDKKTMDSKRRVAAIVNPAAAPVPKPQRPMSSEPSSTNSSSVQVNRVKNQHKQEKLEDQRKFELHDVVLARVQAWSHGKEDNLRSLLVSLPDVIPERLGFSFVTGNKITMADLMLTKKVKINYMKVISRIHPDKLGAFELQDRMVCETVFVALNKAWDKFKEQNNIA